jgi:hypothetical protein
MTGSESPPTVGYVVSRWPRLSPACRLAQAARRTIEAHFAIERNSMELVTLFQRGGRIR